MYLYIEEVGKRLTADLTSGVSKWRHCQAGAFEWKLEAQTCPHPPQSCPSTALPRLQVTALPRKYSVHRKQNKPIVLFYTELYRNLFTFHEWTESKLYLIRNSEYKNESLILRVGYNKKGKYVNIKKKTLYIIQVFIQFHYFLVFKVLSQNFWRSTKFGNRVIIYIIEYVTWRRQCS